MTIFVSFLERISSYKSLAVFALIYLAFPLYFFKIAETRINELSGKPAPVIDLTMGYNPVRTVAMLHDYSPAARAYYVTVESTKDVIYPLVYAFLFAIILVLLYRKNRFGISPRVVLLPFVMQLFDYIENFYIVRLLKEFPMINYTNVTLCEIAKLTKWSIFFVVLFLILNGIVRNLVQRFSQSKV